MEVSINNIIATTQKPFSAKVVKYMNTIMKHQISKQLKPTESWIPLKIEHRDRPIGVRCRLVRSCLELYLGYNPIQFAVLSLTPVKKINEKL